MNQTCQTMQGDLHISLREARLVLDRILLETGLPYGFNAAIREAVLLSEVQKIGRRGGFERFVSLHSTLSDARPAALECRPSIGDAPLEVDCAGQHAWVAVQMLVDLLLAEKAERGCTQLLARNLLEPVELHVAQMLAQRQGAIVSVDICDDKCATGSVTLSLLNQTLPPKDFIDPGLRLIIERGLPVDAALWWSMYRLSLGALRPDDVISRRHAGANIVDESGRVIGRPTDDDTDFSLLTNVEQRVLNP